MYMTVEDRKKLQQTLEYALCETTLDNVQFDEKAIKNFYILALSLIYELNTKDTFVELCNDERLCFCQRLRGVVASLSSLKAPNAFELDFIEQFTNLANCLENLSMQVSRLSVLLNREYANSILTTVPDNVTEQ